MDLSSKEFTLNFRGFDQKDPETVKRFTAFCEANFALAPQTLFDGSDSSDAVVLAHGESPEALEALAKVLREIGARVEVSKECRIEEGEELEAPSTQELHRLFGHHNDDSSSPTDGPACPYPPLGRTLYLLTQSDGVFDRQRLRPRNYRSETRQATPVPPPHRHRRLIGLRAASLTAGLLVLTTATFLLKRTPTLLDGRGQRSSFQSREQGAPIRADSPPPAPQPAKSLSGKIRAHGFNLDLKVVASSRSLSISALTLIPTEDSRMGDGSMIKKIVGEPTFLTETTSGEWSGPVLLSVFLDTDGRESHSALPATISVRVHKDKGTGTASLMVSGETPMDSGPGDSSPTSQARDRLTTFSVPDLPLS
jgi:hypothetical protein